MKINKLNILLAEDDEDDRILFRRALDELVVSVDLSMVNDGEKLMNILRNEKKQLPHILFLDINMPRKNGFECLAEIKQNKKLLNLPVVIYSTSYISEKITQLFKTGAHIYIRKPEEFPQLKEMIRHSLEMATEKIFSKNPLKYILNA